MLRAASLSLARAFAAAALTALAALTLAAPAGAAQFTSISPGLNHTCAVKVDHTAWCWGDGREGQVGVIGAVRPRTPIYVIGSYQSAAISSSDAYWCQTLVDTSVSCSGRAERGQIGNGSVSTAQFPQEVPLTGVTKVAAGAATACAVHTGRVSCWGDGLRGQLGNGDLVESPTSSPVAVAGLQGIVDVAVGLTHACAVRVDGQVLCWGDTDNGKLGNGINSAITRPGVPVTGLTGATSVAAGASHTCALKADTTVWCWGDGNTGQLGLGVPDAKADTAVPVPGLTGVAQLAAGGLTTCAVKSDGGAVCWGDGTAGQIGNGARANVLAPQPVSGITDAMQIGVGTRHACLVTKTLAPFCWGSNASGQLGTGATLTTTSLTPQLVQDFVLGPATFLPASLTGVPAGSTAGGVMQFNHLRLARRSGGACPKRGTLTLTARGRSSRQRITIDRTKSGCTVTGRFLLPSRSQRATKATYRITAAGLKPASKTLKARKQ